MLTEGTFNILSTVYENSIIHALQEHLVECYMNHPVLLWTFVLLAPMLITLLTVAFFYTTLLFPLAYHYYFKIVGYSYIPGTHARSIVLHLWYALSRIWHGTISGITLIKPKGTFAHSGIATYKNSSSHQNCYEIEGLENIPNKGPALLVAYHGPLPLDVCYFTAKYFFSKKRLIFQVVDRCFFKLPGFRILSDCLQMTNGNIDTCADILQKGNLLWIYPGGMRECLFSDENYTLMWENRVGFAKIAVQVKVPIIPVFTKNIQEAFFTPRIGKKWLRGLYEKIRLPIVPIIGGFPVKLRTIVDKAIPYDPDITPEELAKIVSARMKALISRHQQIPGSISCGLMERIPYLSKRKLL